MSTLPTKEDNNNSINSSNNNNSHTTPSKQPPGSSIPLVPMSQPIPLQDTPVTEGDERRRQRTKEAVGLLRKLDQAKARRKRVHLLFVVFIIFPLVVYTCIGGITYLSHMDQSWDTVDDLVIALMLDFILLTWLVSLGCITLLNRLLISISPFNMVTQFLTNMSKALIVALTCTLSYLTAKYIFHEHQSNGEESPTYRTLMVDTMINGLILSGVWAGKCFLVTLYSVLQTHDDLMADIQQVRRAEREVMALVRGPVDHTPSGLFKVPVAALVYDDDSDLGRSQNPENELFDLEAAREEADYLARKIFTRLGLDEGTGKLTKTVAAPCLGTPPALIRFMPNTPAVGITIEDNTDDILEPEEGGATAASLRRSMGRRSTSTARAMKDSEVSEMDVAFPITFDDLSDTIVEVLTKKSGVAAHMDNITALNHIVLHAIDIVAAIVLVVLALALYGFNVGNFWVTFSATLVTFAFALGDYLKGIVSSLTLIFVGKPYQAGDIVKICGQPNEQRVIKVTLLYTLTRDNTGCAWQFSNASVAASPIQNLSRASRIQLAVVSVVNRETKLSQVNLVKKQMENWLALQPRRWFPDSRVGFWSVTNDSHHELKIEAWAKTSWADKDVVRECQSHLQARVLAVLTSLDIKIEDSPTVVIN